MERGEVYLCSLNLPQRSGGAGGLRNKYVVILQGGVNFATCTDVAVLVASTYNGQTVRAFEVVVGVAEGFDHDTVIDGRWPFTIGKSVVNAGQLKLKLDDLRMHEVSVAIGRGLQLR